MLDLTPDERSEYESELTALKQELSDLQDELTDLEYQLNDDPEDTYVEREFNNLSRQELLLIKQIRYIEKQLNGEK